MKKAQAGFTIIELLIVIVIIAILAAISIIAYTGIQGRVNDSAIQADLRNYANKIEEFYVDNGRFPGNAVELNSLGLSRSTSAYVVDAQAVKYCRNGSAYAIAGESKSGNGFYYGNTTGGLRRRLIPVASQWCYDNYSIPGSTGRVAMWANQTQIWDDTRRHEVP